MLIAGRLQGEIKRGTVADGGLKPDLAAVPLDDLLDEGQANAGTLFLVLALQPFEDAKYLVVEFRIDAATVVLHIEDVALGTAVGRGVLRLPADLYDFLGLVV